MRRQSAWIVILVVAAMLAADRPAPAQSGTNVPFVTIASGETSGIREPARLVIRDTAGWSTVWRRHAGQTSTPLPAVDFTREMVVAVFAGESPSPAAATIHRVVADGGTLTVWYSVRDTRPLPDGGGLPSRAAFHMIRIARSALPVEFAVLKRPQVYGAP